MNAMTDSSSQLSLEESVSNAVRCSFEQGAIKLSYSLQHEAIVKVLNNALTTELAWVLPYKLHHFTTSGIFSLQTVDEPMVHANEELTHTDRIARRIVQLSGETDFSPITLLQRSHVEYIESNDLKTMVRVKSNRRADLCRILS